MSTATRRQDTRGCDKLGSGLRPRSKLLHTERRAQRPRQPEQLDLAAVDDTVRRPARHVSHRTRLKGGGLAGADVDEASAGRTKEHLLARLVRMHGYFAAWIDRLCAAREVLARVQLVEGSRMPLMEKQIQDGTAIIK